MVSPRRVNEELKPDQLQAFNKSNPSKPYITGVFKDYNKTFTVGDGKEYVSTATKPFSGSVPYSGMVFTNVGLKSGESYWIAVRAYEDKVRFKIFIIFHQRNCENNDFWRIMSVVFNQFVCILPSKTTNFLQSIESSELNEHCS